VGQWAIFVRAIARSKAISAKQGDPILWRRIVSALLLMSFFWISYVSQTHIHGQPVTPATSGSIVKLLQLGGDRTLPVPGKHSPDDPADCPLCQAVSLTGAAIMPILVALLLVQNVALSVLPRATERIWASYIGFAHQTRGPPTL